QGISRHSPLSFGVANIAVGIVILCIGWSLGGTPGLGTIANAVLVGLFIQGLTSIGWVTHLQHDPLGVRIALLAVGLALTGPASASSSARRSAGGWTSPHRSSKASERL